MISLQFDRSLRLIELCKAYIVAGKSSHEGSSRLGLFRIPASTPWSHIYLGDDSLTESVAVVLYLKDIREEWQAIAMGPPRHLLARCHLVFRMSGQSGG